MMPNGMSLSPLQAGSHDRDIDCAAGDVLDTSPNPEIYAIGTAAMKPVAIWC
jgi:hypothetical protein